MDSNQFIESGVFPEEVILLKDMPWGGWWNVAPAPAQSIAKHVSNHHHGPGWYKITFPNGEVDTGFVAWSKLKNYI